jgi:hypothetical protein
VKNKSFRLVCMSVAASLAAVSAWGFAYLINENTGLPIKWPDAVYPMRAKLGTSPGGGIDFNATAQSAAATWNALLGSTQFQVAVGTGGAGDRNGINEMVFAANVFGESFDENVLAVTTTWRSGNERTEADIVFNSARTWGAYNGPTQPNVTDLRRVAIHELGHALGLDHPDEAGQNFQPPLPIMNSRISSNDTPIADDITGAQNLYGPPGTPPNDSFANAIPITLNSNNTATVTGHTTNATKQAGEPAHAGNAGGHSVWWKWTAPAWGPLNVDTRGSYSDTTLGVYTGSAVNALTEIASDDDITDGVVQASQLTFNVVSGTTYFFAIDGFDGDTAAVTLNLSYTPTAEPPPTITSQPVSTTVTAGNAATFSVTAANATGYQWFFNGNALGGATTTTLNITNAQSANAGSYFVAVSNAAATINSNTVSLTVNAAPPPPPTPTPTPPSSGGGGGGGAPSPWFYGALSLLVAVRCLRRRGPG